MSPGRLLSQVFHSCGFPPRGPCFLCLVAVCSRLRDILTSLALPAPQVFGVLTQRPSVRTHLPPPEDSPPDERGSTPSFNVYLGSDRGEPTLFKHVKNMPLLLQPLPIFLCVPRFTPGYTCLPACQLLLHYHIDANISTRED